MRKNIHPHNCFFTPRKLFGNNILPILFVLFFLAFAGKGWGQTSINIYTEDFSSSTPTGWLIYNAGSGNNWNPSGTVTPFNGLYDLYYIYNASYAANTWAFTKGISMTAGNTYRVEFYQEVYNSLYPEKLQVTVGNAQTVASQTTTLYNNSNLTNTSYTNRVSSEFSPSTSGIYYFAFNCYSVANMSRLMVDNVRIYETCSSPTSIITQNFDGVTTPSMPINWTVADVASDGVYWKTTTSYTPNSSPNAMYIYYNTNGTTPLNDWAISPGLSLQAGVTYLIKFKYKALSSSYLEKLKVSWGSSATAAGMTNATGFDNTGFTNTAFADGVGTITPSSSGTYYVGWHGYSTADKNGIVVDDISIVTCSACNPPAVEAGTAFTKTCTSNSSGAQIGETASSGSTYSWSPTTGLSNSTVSNPTANPTTTTTYTVTETVTATGCTATDNIVVTVNTTAPTAGITNNTGTTVLTCATTSISVTATGGTSYAWSGGSTPGTAANTLTSIGTYPVTVTGANGCTSTAGITITSNTTPPTVGITNNTGTTVLTCSTTSISVTATGGSSYAWSGGSAPSAATNILIAAATYTVTVTGANGCTATSGITITSNTATPTAGITNNSGTTVLTCAAPSISVTATGGISYAWSGGSTPSTAANILTAAGTYTITVTGANGCTATSGITVTSTITPPTAGITNNTGTTVLTCSTTSINLTATGGTSYAWSGGSTPGTAANTMTSAATYTVTVTSAAGCTATTGITITSNTTPPTAGITNNTGTTILTCSTTSISVTATGGTSYAWSGGSTPSTAANSLTSAGAYTVTVTAANGCTATSSITITLNNLPSAPATGTHSPSTTQIVWNWNTVGGATGYKWNTTNSYASATDMGAVLTKTETGLTCNTAYTRYVWAYNTCGNSSATTLSSTTSSCGNGTCGSPYLMTCGTIYSGTLATTGGNWSTYTSCSYTEPGAEKVYSYTPTVTGDYTFTGTNDAGDADFFLMSTCGNAGTNIYGSCWSSGDITVTLNGGTTYYLIADNYSSSLTADYTVTVGCPAGDPCSSVTAISGCGSSYSQTASLSGSGAWYGSSSNPCGYTTPGQEKIYSFIPSTTGSYNVAVTATDGTYIDYMYKASSCSSSGWTCIDDISDPGTYGPFSLTAGTTYYFLLDDENTTASSQTFYITCVGAAEMTVPSSGSNSYTVCFGNLYDYGGSAGNYGTSWSGYTVLYPGTAGNKISLEGTTAGESCCDYIYIYDGINTSATLIGTYVANSGTVPPVTATNVDGALTVQFVSDGSVVGAGFDLTISCVTPGIIVPSTGNNSYTTCNAHIYDHAGGGTDYSCNVNGYSIIYPTDPSMSVQLTGTYDVESGYDYIYIYDGAGTSGTLLGTFSGTGNSSIGTIISSGANIPLTIKFTSDGSVQYSGFDFEISCYSPCTLPSTPANPTAAASPACASTTLTAAAAPAGVSFYWQGTNSSGTSTTDPATSPLTVLASGIYYLRAQRDAGGCWSAASGSVTVTINPNSSGGIVSGGSTICSGSTSGVLTLSGHTGSVTKWQYSNDNFVSNIVDISNTSTTYTSGTLASTTYFRAVVTNSPCGAEYSSVAIVTITPTSVGGTLTGGTTPICLGSGTGTITLNGNTGSIIKWQKRLNGGSWTDISNTNATFSETPSAAGTWGYCAVVQNSPCSQVQSSIVSIVVSAATIGGSVTGGSTPICLSSNTGIMTLSSHTGSIVKWQKRLNGGAWTDITNTLTTYSEIPSSSGIWDYRAVVQNSPCSLEYSNYRTITVNTLSGSSPGTATANPSTIFTGSSSNLSVTGGSLSYGSDYYWYSGSCGGTPVGTGSSISVSPSTTTTYYVRVESSPCSPSPSCVSVTVTVGSPPTGVYNFGANIQISDNAHFYIDGGSDGDFGTGTLGSDGTITVLGTGGFVDLEGDWKNEVSGGGYVYTTDKGTTEFLGANQLIGGTQETHFYNLYLTSTGTKTLDLNTQVGGTTTKTGVLTLDNDVAFNLNQHTVNLTNPANTAIVRNGTSYVISENENSKIKWDIGINTGLYTYPFGRFSGSLRYIPFLFNISSAGTGSGSVTVSTYHTGSDNLPLPSTVTNILAAGINNSLNMADRYWIITPLSYTTIPTANVTFNYEYANGTDNEFYTPNTITESDLQAQRWNGTQWESPIGSDASHYVITPAINTFSPWVLVSKRQPLPVELLNFDAHCLNNKIELKWSTGSETNNDYFTIDRCLDTLQWETLTTVSGAGNSNTINQYSASDNNPYASTVQGIKPTYYRLKQTDFDGQYEYYGPIVSVCEENITENLNAFVNDSRNIIVDFNTLTGLEYTICLFDDRGRQLIAYKNVSDEGFNEVTFNTIGFNNGIYILVFMNEKEYITRKILLN